jgi:DHA1 family multidrug resistance protein-like MFS transporter
MTTQFRDTQFGHLVRFLSHNKLFQYPDELDTTLWQRALQRNIDPTSSPLDDQDVSSEKRNDPNDIAPGLALRSDTQDVDLQDQRVSRTIENGKDTFLIDWYGPDDPEVRQEHLPTH